MADILNKYPENVAGEYFVDNTCIACDACVLAASQNFTMHADDGHSYVSKQPETPEEVAACKEAMDACPVESIGRVGL